MDKFEFAVPTLFGLEGLAGDELRRYLTRMLNAEEGVFSVSLAVEHREGPDAFTVDMDCSGGTIIGSNARSVLLGVYDYLRRLGCRFMTPVKETEVIPRIVRESLPARYKKQASFKHKCLNITYFIE